MLIKNISYGNKIIDFTDHVNIIAGFTNTNKTLLFLAFQYLFSIDSKINKKQATEALNSDFVSATFTDKNGHEFTVKRYFSAIFKAYIDDISFDNVKLYKKALSDKFSFNEIIVKNGTKTNRFFLKNYIELINIPEDQLTSTSNILEREGYSEKGKLVEFFKYLITGKQSPSSTIKESASVAKSAKTISGIETTFNRIYKKVSKKQLNSFEEITKRKSELLLNLDNFKTLSENKRGELFNLEKNEMKLLILKDSYKNDLDDFDFSGIYNDLSIDETNGETIIDEEYYNGLKQSINDIDNVLDFYKKKIQIIKEGLQKDCSNINRCQEEISKCEKEIKSLEIVAIYKKTIEVKNDLNQKNEQIKKRVDSDICKTEKEKDEIYHVNIRKLCNSISERIKDWGLPNFTTVEFDFANCNFLFDSKTLQATPKGYKSILTLATNCEILLLAKKLNISIPNFIVIDSLWLASFFKEVNIDELKSNIVNNLANSNIQIIILENEVDKKKLDNCNYTAL